MQRLLSYTAMLILLVGCGIQTVDVDQPITVANKFYGALEAGDEKTALNQFAPEFKKQEQNWPRLLNGLQQRYGPVTAAHLDATSLAALDSGPCYTLTYSVKRGGLASREILFLCAKGHTSTWLIRGHAFTRLDTQQTISGGLIVREVGVHFP
jgi:hypothetical protein